MGKLFFLGSLSLWTAYHVKTIKYQNDRIVNVILIHHSFSWNMPNFLEKWQEVRRTLKLEGKCKSRLNSNCNIGTTGWSKKTVNCNIPLVGLYFELNRLTWWFSIIKHREVLIFDDSFEPKLNLKVIFWKNLKG